MTACEGAALGQEGLQPKAGCTAAGPELTWTRASTTGPHRRGPARQILVLAEVRSPHTTHIILQASKTCVRGQGGCAQRGCTSGRATPQPEPADSGSLASAPSLLLSRLQFTARGPSGLTLDMGDGWHVGSAVLGQAPTQSQPAVGGAPRSSDNPQGQSRQGPWRNRTRGGGRKGELDSDRPICEDLAHMAT